MNYRLAVSTKEEISELIKGYEADHEIAELPKETQIELAFVHKRLKSLLSTMEVRNATTICDDTDGVSLDEMTIYIEQRLKDINNASHNKVELCNKMTAFIEEVPFTYVPDDNDEYDYDYYKNHSRFMVQFAIQSYYIENDKPDYYIDKYFHVLYPQFAFGREPKE